MVNRFARIGVGMALLSAGCISYTIDPALPRVEAAALPKVERPMPVKLVYTTVENGKKASDRSRVYFESAVKRAGVFTLDKKATAELRIHEEDTYDPAAHGRAFLVGLTFTLAPLDEKADMRFTVELVEPGRPTVKQTYDSVTHALTGSKRGDYPTATSRDEFANTLADSIVFRFAQSLRAAGRI